MSKFFGARLGRALVLLTLLLFVATVVALWLGYAPISLAALQRDEAARALFFRLRLPRVLLAGMVGGSLAMVGASLQALFRNPLAEPLTLGVSGGGALGASVAIALGAGAKVAGAAVRFFSGLSGGGGGAGGWCRSARARGGVC